MKELLKSCAAVNPVRDGPRGDLKLAAGYLPAFISSVIMEKVLKATSQG